MTDPIADMLTRIRNANQNRAASVEVPASNVKLEIARILKDEGFIEDYAVTGEGVQKMMTLTLKYKNKERVITGLKRISKPGLRVYSKAEELPTVLNGLGIAIISTSKGIMTDKEARQLSIPENVNVNVENNVVTVKGPKGELSLELVKNIKVTVDNGVVKVEPLKDDKFTHAMHGTTNANIKNMIEGVSNGYKKSLEIV